MTDISATSFFRQAEAAPHGIHRGIDVRLSPEDHSIVHDESRPPHERAQHLIDTVTREGYEPLGQHWSTDRTTAEEFSHRNGPVRNPERTKVVFHAEHPEHDEIEHDPGWREEHAVNDLEDEVPLKKGVDVSVHSISWQRGDQYGKPWNRHTFSEEQWHTASLRRTAAVEDGDDIPSRLLNPHGHHIKARVGGWTNVEMVPRQEVERYASQETDTDHTKEVGYHLATTGEMEPLMLHYHPDSGEAYLGEGNHRLRAARALGMDHVPLRVSRSAYGLPGPGVKVPQDHPAIAAGQHVPADIHPSHIGLTTVDKPTMSEWDKRSELAKYRLLHPSKTATYAESPLPSEIHTWQNTQWDVPHQVDEPIHRGLTLPLSPEDHAHIHDESVSPGKRAAHIVKLVSKDGNLGRHWTTDPDMASHYSVSNVGEMKHHPHVLAVSLHAHPPAAEHIEHDPVELGRMGVKAQSVEAEIPLKHDAPVRMYGVSWHNPRDHSQSGRYIATAQAKGITRNASADTPVPNNTQPYEHEHDWLPRDHFFAPGEEGLDPRLFGEDERMHPIVRQHILSLLNTFWAPKYGDSWQTWARVYLAGSEASHFYGNGDLDILIGVDYARARELTPALAALSDEEISTHLTDELRHGLNDDARMLPGLDGKETGPWENTWYVNPDSYDIRDIKPYAAYDITRDEWAVKPVEVPADFGPEKLPESTWDVFEAVQKLIGAVRELPEGVREREGAALYDYLHADRHSAFGPEGSGLYDPANAVWKALDKAPGSPLQQLIDWKHAHDGVAAATDQEKAA